jgi:urocanate reductase
MSQKRNVSIQTRRNFIKHTFIGMAAGFSAASLGPGVKEVRAETSAGNWARKTDVVVVGSGVGGCASALAAHEAGAKVLILEKAPKHFFGGNSSVSGGNFYASAPEEYSEKLMDMSAGRADKTAVKTLADNAASSIKWLDNIGVRLNWTKQEGYAIAPNKGSGAMKDLLKILQNKGIEVLFETKAKRLLQDDRQRVIGVHVATKTEFINVKAEKAVILATGGYLGSQEMTVRYIGPQATAIVDRGFVHITGDGHSMAQELGASLINMGDCRLEPMQPKSKASVSSLYPYGIIVNKECQRFIDEAKFSTSASDLGKAILKQTDGIGYAIFDEKWRTLVSSSSQKRFAESGGELKGADSIAELAEALGLNPITLQQTIDEFNAAVKESMALGLHPPKTGDTAKLDEPKFYGTPVVNGSTLTFGGVRINKRSQVVNLEGSVIPRLYAVGILVGGIYYQNYRSGCGLASAVTFGKLAGSQAAAEKPLS